MNHESETRLKIAIGSFKLDFEGSETFLRSEIPKLMEVAGNVHATRLALPLGFLQSTLEESIGVSSDLDKSIDAVKSDLDSMSEMGEMESLRLQMAMDRMSKMMSMLSNLLKKMSDTTESIVQNLK